MKSIEEWTLYIAVAILLMLFVLVIAIADFIKRRREVDEQHEKAHKNLQTVADKTLALVAESSSPEMRSVEGMRSQNSGEHGTQEGLLRQILTLVQKLARLMGFLETNADHPPTSKGPPPEDKQ